MENNAAKAEADGAKPDWYTVRRMCPAGPLEGGRFCFRLLITEASGCTPYDCLKTLPGGTVCETFREAAAARGLLRDDRGRFLAFEEAASHATPGHYRCYSLQFLRIASPVLRVICGAFSANTSQMAGQTTLSKEPPYS